MQKRPNNSTPRLFREKSPRHQPTTRVHTAETTINGKTYETTTIETPYGSTTTTKEKKPKTAEQQEREQKIMDVVMWISLVVFAILLVIGFLRKNGILYLW